MAKLPDWITNQMPVHVTACGAIDRDTFALVSYDVTHGQSFASAAQRINTVQHQRHAETELEYLQFWEHRQQPGQQASLDDPKQRSPPPFGQLGDGSVIKAYITSAQYLSTLWLNVVESRVEVARLAMSAVKGRFWCLDHTFKIAKFVRDASCYQQLQAVLTLQNELGKIVAQFFTHTTSMLEVKKGLMLIKGRYDEEKGLQVN